MKSTHPERPRGEPEIIPPGRTQSRSSVKWTSHEQRGTHRIYVTRLGPFSTVILILTFAALLAILSLILIGTFLIWIPVAVFLIVIALISGWWQRIFRH